jgi:hypothetical protein
MSAVPVVKYPWYNIIVTGDELEQGDILEGCPVFSPPADLGAVPAADARFRWEERDLVILSQSCDLVKGRKKLEEVLLCAVWNRSEMTGHLANDPGMEDARRGNLPGYHVLAECTIADFHREIRVVDFRRVYSLPIDFIRARAASAPHLRLLPPYREHLSQSFARYFMRVGLPSDIPAFAKR